MYESHFGLRRRPFRSLPDTESYYAATTHEQSLARLFDAVNTDEGLALLTGTPGTGKSVLGHCLVQRLGNKVSTAFLLHSHFGDRAGLIRAILYDLGLSQTGNSEEELRLELLEYLLKNYEEGRRTVVILDEAQRLTPDLLEELRLLTNYEGDRGKTFQVVLLAQPILLQLLKLPDLAVFDQRLSVRAQLEPLGIHEAADYLLHLIRAEGGRPEKIITDEALQVLARETDGVPRLLNRAADHAFKMAYAAEAKQVDVEAVFEALSEMGLGSSVELEMPNAGLSAALEDNQPNSLQVDPAESAVLCIEDIIVDKAVEAQRESEIVLKPTLVATPKRPA